MSNDQGNGAIDEMVGVARHKAGELADNSQLQVEGMAQQGKGKVENAWGKAKDTAGGAADDAAARPKPHV